MVASTSYRDVFFDAPLPRLYEDPDGDGAAASDASLGNSSGSAPQLQQNARPRTGAVQWARRTSQDSVFDPTNSHFASMSFTKSIGRIWSADLSDAQLQQIRGQIRGARRRGLQVRYWSTPSWPVSLRNAVWDLLRREGVDYLNADDIEAASKLD